jgi:hypothetical protein
MPALTSLLSRKLAALGAGLIAVTSAGLDFRGQCLAAGLSVVAMVCQALNDRAADAAKGPTQ